MHGTAKKIEVAANISIIALTLLIGSVFLSRYLFGVNQKVVEDVQVGEKLTVSQVNWTQSKLTLILVLQEGCHFCTDSAPFYRRFKRELGDGRKVRLIAVFPQPVNDGQNYLNGLEVFVDEVKEAELSSIKVAGTPTLILVDNSGTVTKIWRGKLNTDQETEVLDHLKSL